MYTAALLDKQRYEVEVLSGPQTGSEGSLIEEVRQRGVPLTILPSLLRQVSPANDLSALSYMAQFMRQGGFTIVHTHSSKAGVLGRIAAKRAGVPIIVHTIHGWSFHNYMPTVIRMAYVLLERIAASYSQALIAVSRRDIQKGLRHRIGTADQYHLIRSGIPLQDFNPTRWERQAVRGELGIPEEAVVIGNVGRFSAQKNPLDWVRVAGEVAKIHPKVHFLLVGDGPLRAQVLGEIARQGIVQRLILPGLRRDAAHMLAAMDIFMLTSLWEGLPRVIPQAMAMKLPVIAYQADGINEAIQDNETGFLCPAGEIARMAERCLTLLENPDERKRMGEKGKALANQEFGLDKMISQIDKLYRRLLQKT